MKNILQFWKTKPENKQQSGLVADFKDLAAMRRYVPYLKELKFNQTALQSGDAKSAFKGRGMEFEEVRSYNYGDDVRDIDWRVTARKNQPYTKLYAQEKDREVYVWLDMSANMLFGTRQELKSVTAAKIAALLGWFALENKDRFGVALFDGRKTYLFEPKRTSENLLSILKKLEEISGKILQEEEQTQLASKSLQLLQKKISRRSIVFVISGFEAFAQNFSREISKLAHGNEVYLVNVFDVLEEIAPPAGEYLAQYGQQQQLLLSGGKDFALFYQEHFAQKRDDIRNFCAKFNCRYREVRTDLPIYKQLRPI